MGAGENTGRPTRGRLKGRVALVSGAAQGGQALAIRRGLDRGAWMPHQF